MAGTCTLHHISGVLPEQMLCSQRSLQVCDPQHSVLVQSCRDVCGRSLGRALPRSSHGPRFWRWEAAEQAASEDARCAAGSSSLVLAGVLLSLAEPGPEGGGALYWKQHLSAETYYLALLTQGHCKSYFFFPHKTVGCSLYSPAHHSVWGILNAVAVVSSSRARGSL